MTSKLETYLSSLIDNDLPDDWQIFISTEDQSKEDQVFTLSDIKEMLSDKLDA